MEGVRLLVYITRTVDKELLLRNEYLAAENRILKAQLKTPCPWRITTQATHSEEKHLDKAQMITAALPTRPRK